MTAAFLVAYLVGAWLTCVAIFHEQQTKGWTIDIPTYAGWVMVLVSIIWPLSWIAVVVKSFVDDRPRPCACGDPKCKGHEPP